MKEQLLLMLINALIGMLTPELLRELADKVIDFAEEKVEDSETKIDDWLVLPVVKMVRDTFNIPDNDEE